MINSPLMRSGPDLENPVLSWVSNLTQLTHLMLSGYDFSKLIPTWIGKLTRLESLTIWDCSFSLPIPYQIGNLTKLAELELWSCDFSEQRIPSWIGNLTKLTSLDITYCNFSGPIPPTIGNLIRLEDLSVCSSNISGETMLRLLTSLYPFSFSTVDDRSYYTYFMIHHAYSVNKIITNFEWIRHPLFYLTLWNQRRDLLKTRKGIYILAMLRGKKKPWGESGEKNELVAR